jgi:hypothetical protein
MRFAAFLLAFAAPLTFATALPNANASAAAIAFPAPGAELAEDFRIAVGSRHKILAPGEHEVRPAFFSSDLKSLSSSLNPLLLLSAPKEREREREDNS